jgi:uncharacterized protein YkwD
MALRRPLVPRRARLGLEFLETRCLLSGYQPTAVDQLFLEELNDARANPAAYGASIGLDLSQVAPSQPLAFNPQLMQAAVQHSQDMSSRGYFAHNTPEGIDPSQRMTQAGFNWQAWGESIAAGGLYPQPADALRALIIDNGVPDLGHRIHLLAMDALFQGQNQVGIGALQNTSGPLQNYYTIDTAQAQNSSLFLTGVVFNDANKTGKYVIGEGLAGVTISVAGVGSTTTFDSGGYSIAVAPGTYTVTASGGGLPAPLTQTVTVGGSNYRLNFIAGSESYVGHLYETVLGREASAAEVALWTPALTGPGGRAAVASGIEHSGEARTRLVRSWYATYLGRQAANGEEQGWVTSLLNGASEEDVLTAILSSQEFYDRASRLSSSGTGDQRYVTALYSLVLGRQGSPNEAADWLAPLASVGRSAVASAFLRSGEYRTDLIVADYSVVLHRQSAPSATEVATWQASGLDTTNLRVAFEVSGEFFPLG